MNYYNIDVTKVGTLNTVKGMRAANSMEVSALARFPAFHFQISYVPIELAFFLSF